MDQQTLVQDVVTTLLDTPQEPANGRYLSLKQAEAIVDDTIAYVLRHSDAVEHKYLVGHRRRLAISLSMIPMAQHDGATCLDIGCYGYMGFWASRHLGYARVEGIELRPDKTDPVMNRVVEMDGQRLQMVIYNFDLALTDWPIEKVYDTILFFETLEHVSTDPMAVMLNIAKRMHCDSTLVMSVPNAVSHKTLQEFLMGAPPWVYWFFHPDLRHEPRHCFEYTPIFLKILLRSAGFQETVFRTICGFSDRESLNDVFELGAALSVEPALFGETIIAQAHKSLDEPLIRYPDCIYDGDAYYRTTYPLLEPILHKAKLSFLERWRGHDERVAAIEARANEAAARADAAERRAGEAEAQAKAAGAKVAETLFICDRYQAREDGLFQRVRDAEGRADAAERRAGEAEAQARDARTRVEEALFICDRYQAREDELFQRANDAEGRAAQAEARYEAIVRSSFWRITGPARRLTDRFPAVKSTLRPVLTLVYHRVRHVARAISR